MSTESFPARNKKDRNDKLTFREESLALVSNRLREEHWKMKQNQLIYWKYHPLDWPNPNLRIWTGVMFEPLLFHQQRVQKCCLLPENWGWRGGLHILSHGEHSRLWRRRLDTRDEDWWRKGISYLSLGALITTTTTPRKTSLENKDLRNYGYFTIIPPCSNDEMLVKNTTTRLQGALLK